MEHLPCIRLFQVFPAGRFQDAHFAGEKIKAQGREVTCQEVL